MWYVKLLKSRYDIEW